ncbi:unnamed protein product [Urochloa humidicola]
MVGPPPTLSFPISHPNPSFLLPAAVALIPVVSATSVIPSSPDLLQQLCRRGRGGRFRRGERARSAGARRGGPVLAGGKGAARRGAPGRAQRDGSFTSNLARQICSSRSPVPLADCCACLQLIASTAPREASSLLQLIYSWRGEMRQRHGAWWRQSSWIRGDLGQVVIRRMHQRYTTTTSTRIQA